MHPSRIFLSFVFLLALLAGTPAVQAAAICPPSNTLTTPTADFTDNADGTVTHLKTGLMWKQCAEGLSGASCATGSATFMNWNSALSAAATPYAGFSDWRLPNQKELRSIVETGCYGPSINETAFPATPADYFWSSTSYASDPRYAWDVNFSVSVASASFKTNTFYVRLVRSGQSVDTFDAQNPAVTSYTAPSATSTGNITASFTGGGAGCGYTVSQYIPLTGHAASPPAGSAPAGVSFPQGLFDFTTGGCTAGSTITMTITYPQALPAGTQYWKYGPTPTDGSYHWYVLPATIAGSTATFTITDGGLGDDDLAEDGTIVDQGGPGAGAASAIPTLSEWGMLLLAGLVLLFGAARMRRRG